MDDALGFLKDKLSQGLSDVEQWGSDAGNDVTHALGQIFGGNSPQAPTQTQQAPQNQQNLNVATSLSKPLTLQTTAPSQQQNPLKTNLFSTTNTEGNNQTLNTPQTLNTKLVNYNAPKLTPVAQAPTPTLKVVKNSGGFLGNVVNGLASGARDVGGAVAAGNRFVNNVVAPRIEDQASTALKNVEAFRHPVTAINAINQGLDPRTPQGKQNIQSAAIGAEGGLDEGVSDSVKIAGFNNAASKLDPDIATATDKITKVANQSTSALPKVNAPPVKPTAIAPEETLGGMNFKDFDTMMKGDNPSQTEMFPEDATKDMRSIQSLAKGQGIKPQEITEDDRRQASYTSTTPKMVAGKRLASNKLGQIKLRNPDAERGAQDILQNGGSRQDAIKAYKDSAPNISDKDVKFRVAQVARESKTALHPNEAGVNPLEGKMSIPLPKDGDYRGVQIASNKVEGTIDSAAKQTLSFSKLLSDDDKANLRDYVEGTKDVNEADDPDTVAKAVSSARNLFDTVHAIDPLPTRYVQNFFPEYWDQEDPEVQGKALLQAQQDLEEEVGPKVWNNMSDEQKSEMLAERTQDALGGNKNYNANNERGFHSQARVFANHQEGLAAGMKPLNDDPFDDIKQYATGAKLDMNAKIVRRAVGSADASESLANGAKQPLNLGGGKTVMVSDKAFPKLRGLAVDAPRGRVAKAWQGLTNMITQAIVLNPGIHGANLAVQGFIESGKRPLFDSDTLLGKIPSGPIGGVRFLGNTVRLLASKGARDDAVATYKSDGGHVSSYGKDSDTVISRALDKADLPHVNKLNAASMSKIDEIFRASIHDDDLRKGVDPDKSVRNIDNFMGDQRYVPEIAKDTGLFYHWVRTEVTAIAHTAVSPGALANAGIALGVFYGLNKAWQTYTGNKNATVRYPGELGLLKEGYSAATKHNEQTLTAPITNHVNPLITAGINQIYGKDEFTGAKLQTPGQRGSDALSTLVSPAQGVTKIMAGKKSPAEVALNLGGLTTPHATGAPAVPNNNPLAKVVNTPGAKPVTGGSDKTGYSQEVQYYNAMDSNITNNAKLGAADQSAATDFISRNKTPTGQTIENNIGQSTADWAQLASHPGALSAVQKFEQQSGSHDPEWDLNPSQLKTYATYKSLAPGDPEKDVLMQQNPWINQTVQNSVNWAAKQTFSGTAVAGPGYVPYPTISNATNSAMAQITTLAAIPAAQRTATQISQLDSLENNPGVQSAYNALDTYTNKERASMGLSQINYEPTIPPQVTNFMTAYTAANTADRATMKSANPNMYAAMQQAYENIDLSETEKQGAVAYLGGTPSQDLLSGAYGLGNYDINKGTNANGTSSYSLTNFGGVPLDNSGLAVANSVNGYAPGSSSSSSSSSDPLVAMPKIKHIKQPKMRKPPKLKGFRAPHIKKQGKVKVQSNGALRPTQVLKGASVVKVKAQ